MNRENKVIEGNSPEIKETVYWGPNCVTRYWVWNEEHNCIAYGKIDSSYDMENKKEG